MRIGVVGPLEVEADGRNTRIGGARSCAMVARLALAPGRAIALPALTEALWPGGGVELGTVADDADVPPAVASALGIAVSGEPMRRPTDELATGPALLVLDGGEHYSTGRRT